MLRSQSFRIPAALILPALLVVASCTTEGPTQPTEVRRSSSTGTTAPAELQIGSAAAGETTADLDSPIDVEETADLAEGQAAPRTFVVSGVVTDRAYPSWKISNATVTVSSVSARTGSAGTYSLRSRSGANTIRVSAPGYSTASIRKSVSRNTTVNAALNPIVPSGATARCKDRTWSRSQNRSGTCSHHRGVAYWVCPGRLCR